MTSGGTLLKHLLADTTLAASVRLFTLVRSDDQAEHVTKLGATPVWFDLDEEACRAAVVKYESEFDGLLRLLVDGLRRFGLLH